MFQVFSKSLIFRDEYELKSNKGSVDSFDNLDTKSEPDYLSDKPNRTKVRIQMDTKLFLEKKMQPKKLKLTLTYSN